MSQRKATNPTAELDELVRTLVQKSVVTAPSDPNGGAKLPKRQEGAAKRKGKGKEQYMAVFDREAQDSDDQLDDWLDATQETTQSPDEFVEDARKDDAPEDYDDQDWEDNRGEVYDPLGDDDELDAADIESLDLPEDNDEYIKVRGHKRRKKVRKSHAAARGDMDEDFADLSDDDDLDEEDDDDEDERPKRKVKKSVRSREQDDEEDEREQDDLDDEEEDEKAARRRKQVRKSLGVDAMKYVDGSPVIKALTDAVFDINDKLIMEVRALRMENRKLTRKMAGLVRQQNRALAKSLTQGQLMIAGYEVPSESAPARQSAPLRKGYGQPIQTSQPASAMQPITDLTKAFDALEDAYASGDEPDLLKAITMLENDGVGAVPMLPKAAHEVLRKAGLLR